MPAQTIVQLSHFDDAWGFNPDWVLGDDYSHLDVLLKQISDIDIDSKITLVTGNKPEDDAIVEIANRQNVDVRQLNQARYEDNGFMSVVEQSDSPWIQLISGYSASIYTNFLSSVINQIFEKEQDMLAFNPGQTSVHFPAIMKRSLLKQAIDCYPNQYDLKQAFVCPIQPPHQRILPPWIQPGFLVHLVQILSLWDEQNYKWVTFGDNGKHKLPQKLSNDFGKFRSIISSQHEADEWASLKQKQNNKSYTDLVQSFSETFQPDRPECIQIDLPSDRKLYPWIDIPSKKTDFTPQELLETVSATSTSPCYQTLLQFGVYMDPISNSSFTKILKTFSNRFRLMIRSRGAEPHTQLNPDDIADQVDEIFIHKAAETAKNHDFFYPDISFENSINEIQSLVQASKDVSLNRFEDVKNPKRNNAKSHLFPILSIQYFITNQILESGELTRVFDNYVDENTWRNNNPDLDYTEFLKQSNTINHIIASEPPRGDQLEVTLPDYAPLERFPCRRMKQSLYIRHDGEILPCDQLFLNNDFSLGNIKNVTLQEAWNSDKRKRFLALQREGEYETFSECEYWYQPIL